MILESILVENFLSHRHSEVCFEHSHLWLIGGENGAGKSALFDALEYAFYGKHRGGGTNDKLLVKQGSRRAKIVIVFQYNNDRYRIIHEIDAKDGNKGGRLDIWDEDINDWQPKNVGTGVKSVWKWVERELPSHEHFRSAIFLHQNETAHFLRGSSEERSLRFAALLNLSRYTELSLKAQAFAEDARKRRDLACGRDNELGDLTDETLQQHEAELGVAQDTLAQAEAAYILAQQLTHDATNWARFQLDRQRQNEQAGSLKALLEAEDSIRAAAQRVSAWDKVAAAFATYWERYDASSRLAHEDTLKRNEVEQIAQELAAIEQHLTADRQRLEILEQDELPTAQKHQEMLGQQKTSLEIEQQIAQTSAEVVLIQQRIELLSGADVIYEELQRRLRALPHLEQLVTTREVVAKTELTYQTQKVVFEEARQAALEAQAILEGFGPAVEAAEQRRTQCDQVVSQLEADIALFEGRIESHRGLSGTERECPVCAQELSEPAFLHLQEVLKDDLAVLEKKRNSLENEARMTLASAAQEVAQLKHEQELQRGETQKVQNVENEQRERYQIASRQYEIAQANYANAQQTLLAIDSPQTQLIADIDSLWVAKERSEVEDMLPRAADAAADLAAAQKTWSVTHTKLSLLRERRTSDSEPLGDQLAIDQVTALLHGVDQKVLALHNHVETLKQNYADLMDSITRHSEQRARLIERIDHIRQRVNQIESDLLEAKAEAQRLYGLLYSQWPQLLDDRTAYDAEREEIESLRAQVARIGELDQAYGRLEEIEKDIRRINTEIELIPLGHHLLPEQARQMEADAVQKKTIAYNGVATIKSTIADFLQKCQDRKMYHQQMEEADQEWNTFNELVEMLKPGGYIQKMIAEQEQRRIASEANRILELLNDPLRIRIDRARRGGETQDVTIIDTSDLAGGNSSTDGSAHRYFEFLSGGEKFRIALALALAVHRRIAGGVAGTIIIDEGFGALDGDRRDRLALQLTDTVQGILGQELAHSLIICSHSTEVQRHFRDNCWIVEKRAGTASVKRLEDSLA